MKNYLITRRKLNYPSSFNDEVIIICCGIESLKTCIDIDLQDKDGKIIYRLIDVKLIDINCQ